MLNHSIITYAKMRSLAMEAAVFWREWVYPLPFDHTFPLEGLRVHIVIEKAVSPDDTQPIKVAE
jgi:hypothetical protein